MRSIGEDRLRMLPEEITTRILSLMPTKYAVRTSILSKTWRHSWMLLKNLDIVVRRSPFVKTLQIIHDCPVLESLSLEVRIWKEEGDCIFNIPTLKRLKLTLHRIFTSYSNKVVLNVPNLQFLFVGGVVLDSIFVMEDVSSLVEACVSFENITSDHLSIELLKGLSGVNSLSIHSLPLYFLCSIPRTSALPVFPNMKHLELTRLKHFALVLQFLESCPELKHLCVEEVTGQHSFEVPKRVPACMLTNLTTIKISNCLGMKPEMDFIKYMLGNAEVLKTVTLITSEFNFIEDEKWLCAQLLELPRAFRFCKFHFIGRKWHFTTS